LLEAKQEDVEQVDGIGPDRAEAIVDWFVDEQNRALIEELRSLGINFELSEDERPKDGPLKGNTYVITGTLESMSREQAAVALEELGAKVTNAVSAKTTALIAGEEPGNSKLTKAQKVGTTILSERDLLGLLGTK
jgi:DNA ligase (NAD+)